MRHRIKLKGMFRDELQGLLLSWGEPPFRADQIYEWIYGKGVCRFADMTNLPLALRARLEQEAEIGCLVTIKVQSAPDGTAKYLFGLADGEAIESVLLRHDYGLSACVSTQVGCRMGCRFCASTIGGRVRDLDAGEMYDQVLAISRELPPGQRVSSVVLMGSGEPLDNYDQVMKFIRLLNDPRGLGIGYRHITLSTCGLVPGIRRLAREGLPVTLSVSLHAPDDTLRSQLVPINRRYRLAELLPACMDYAAATGRRVTFEYSLIRRVNDAPRQAHQLAGLLRGTGSHINLIPANPVAGREYERSSPGRVASFRRILEEHGLSVTVRRELGAGIAAACGQLRRRYLARSPGDDENA